jgi:hypothetical protein
MKAFGILLVCLFCLSAQGATSDLLFATGGGSMTNSPGNVVFNGQHFVTPTVAANGAIYLTMLNTNGVAISNESLSITGSSPRVAYDGTQYVLAWLATNESPNTLAAAQIAGGTVGTVSVLGTNVADETVSLNAAGAQLLVVWQSAGSNSSVFARAINFSGAPVADTIALGSTPLPQRYPSLDNDGTNHLVCWMQQNESSNDWRVVAQRVTGGALNGTPVQVSETNSMRPYATACSFGTNFLVAWSADELPVPIEPNACCFDGATNLWRSTVHGRMLSGDSNPLGHEQSLARSGYYSTNVVAVFAGDRYVVCSFSWETMRQAAHFFNADGTRRGYPTDTLSFFLSQLRPRLATGAGKVCVIYQVKSAQSGNTSGACVMFAPQYLAEIRLTDLRRTNAGIAAALLSYATIEVSTNFIHWEGHRISDLPSMGGRPQLFVRAVNHTWTCIQNLRAIDWAKQAWAFDYLRSFTDTPNDFDLFGPGHYLMQKPSCPLNGTYTLGQLDMKPTCTIADHTL